MPSPSVPPARDDGFTLVELLVIIVVIAVLTGIAVPLFLGQREKAYDAAAKADLRNLAMAVTGELQAGHGNYTSVAEMSITVAETPDGGRRYVMSGVRAATSGFEVEQAPVDLGPVSHAVVLEVDPGSDDGAWTFRTALAAFDTVGPSGRDDVVRADWCIGVGHADSRGAEWRYTPTGGYAEGRCFEPED